MSFVWEEDTIRECVQRSLETSILSVNRADADVVVQIACLEEALTAEIVEWGAKGSVPDEETAVQARLDAAGIDTMLGEFELGDDEIGYLLESIVNVMADLTYVEDESEDLRDGECELCEREIPITRHHVNPKMVHTWAEKMLGRSKKELHSTIGICRPCHNAVHKMGDHKKLAEFYNTREKLLDAPEIQKFAAWARKQKVKGVRAA